jgi:hypothetical protein
MSVQPMFAPERVTDYLPVAPTLVIPGLVGVTVAAGNSKSFIFEESNKADLSAQLLPLVRHILWPRASFPPNMFVSVQ